MECCAGACLLEEAVVLPLIMPGGWGSRGGSEGGLGARRGGMGCMCKRMCALQPLITPGIWDSRLHGRGRARGEDGLLREHTQTVTRKP